MRPLTLHVSALSDAEYALYTASFDDLATDTHHADYERAVVGAREVRAWLRGRYSHLAASDIDSILKLFCPNMLPSDTLTGGQFFAALRLAVHAESGKGVDRTLAFVQASPRTVKAPDSPRPFSPPKRPGQAPPSHPDRQRPSPLPTPSPETNPFVRKSMDHPAPPIDPEQHPPQRVNRISQNPFLARDHGLDKSAPANHASQGKLPPLPPRKPSLLAAPPRRPSDAAPTPITSTASLSPPSGPPLIPVKPTHVMSPLMRQSLEASKHAQTLKRAEEQRDRDRVLSVLKTTSSSASATAVARTRSLSPAKLTSTSSNGHVPGPPSGSGSGSGGSDDATYVPPLPMRRKPSLPSSTTSSVLSLEQVANATLPSPAAPRPPRPARDRPSGWPHAELPAIAGPGRPPTHPRRRPSTSATESNENDARASAPPSPRAARSHSITVPPSTTAPPPPPRRKRPESMRLAPSSDAGDPAPPGHAHARTFSGVSRHLSLTRAKEREPESPMTHFQKTLSNLQLRAQPKLDAVRYKAEAGISRRGYVHHAQLGPTRWRDEGERGLMDDARWTATNVDPDSDPTTDDEQSSGEARRTRSSHPDVLTESDNLKWPMGEGWKPL